jgi:opacity protein-like surface antigen
MKKWVLVAALAMLVASPAMAAEKKAKKAARPMEEPLRHVDSNEASWRLVKGALPIILPSWSMPLYMQVHGNQAAAEQAEQERRFKQGQQGQPGQAAKPAKKKKAAARAN